MKKNINPLTDRLTDTGIRVLRSYIPAVRVTKTPEQWLGYIKSKLKEIRLN